MQVMTRKNQSLWIFGLAFAVWAMMYSQSPNIENIEPTDAYNIISMGRTLILDVRSKEAFGKEHLPNAISIPLSELTKRMQEITIAKTGDIVVYCNDGATTGPRATAKLNKAGYVNAKNLKGGIQGWRAAKYKTVK